MHCEQAEMLLAQLVFDELAEPVRVELQTHLDGCAGCSEKLGDMRVTANLLREAVAGGAEPVLGDQRRAQLVKQFNTPVKRLKKKPTRSKAKKRAGRPAPRWSGPSVIAVLRWSTAAAALLALGVGVLGLITSQAMDAPRRTARRMPNVIAGKAWSEALSDEESTRGEPVPTGGDDYGWSKAPDLNLKSTRRSVRVPDAPAQPTHESFARAPSSNSAAAAPSIERLAQIQAFDPGKSVGQSGVVLDQSRSTRDDRTKFGDRIASSHFDTSEPLGLVPAPEVKNAPGADAAPLVAWSSGKRSHGVGGAGSADADGDAESKPQRDSKLGLAWYARANKPAELPRDSENDRPTAQLAYEGSSPDFSSYRGGGPRTAASSSDRSDLAGENPQDGPLADAQVRSGRTRADDLLVQAPPTDLATLSDGRSVADFKPTTAGRAGGAAKGRRYGDGDTDGVTVLNGQRAAKYAIQDLVTDTKRFDPAAPAKAPPITALELPGYFKDGREANEHSKLTKDAVIERQARDQSPGLSVSRSPAPGAKELPVSGAVFEAEAGQAAVNGPAAAATPATTPLATTAAPAPADQGAAAASPAGSPSSQQPGGGQAGGQARDLYARQKRSEAAGAEKAGGYAEAAKRFGETLRLDPNNALPKEKLDEAKSKLSQVAGERDMLESTVEAQGLQSQAAVAEYRQLMNRADSLRKQKNFAASNEAAQQAGIVLDRNRRFLPQTLYKDLRDQSGVLSSDIQKQRAQTQLATIEQVERTRSIESNERRAQAGRETRDEVQRLLHRAAELRRGQQYDRALELVDQAQFLDPNNTAAQAMQEILEDTKVFAQSRDAIRVRKRESSRQSVENSKATIPYSDVMTYPKNWPAITAKRLGAAEGGKQGPVVLSELRSSKNAPEFDLNSALSNTDSGGSRTREGVALASKALFGESDIPSALPSPNVAPPTSEQSAPAAAEPKPDETAAALPLTDAAAPQPPAPQPQEAAPAPVFKAGPVNPWVMTDQDRLSTFALDTDTASYSICRNYINQGHLPPPASVRMEEYVNAFDYNYPVHGQGVFCVHAEAAPSPFAGEGKRLTLLKIGVKGKVIGREVGHGGRKAAHLVFVVDGSGSMARPDRLPLVQQALKLLVGQLSAQDRVSLVIYGTRADLVLEATAATEQQQILDAINSVQPNGSTNLIDGLRLGYQIAERQYQPNTINRVILCSDGVANVGQTEAQQVLGNVETYRKHGITFTAAGFGHGTYNDNLMEQLANRGDGNYLFVDTLAEARRVFVDQFSATLQTIAKDAKIQVDFDPARVRRYRLIGYENREIADKDFRNDAIDAGEVGGGQSATALYELELLDAPVARDGADSGNGQADLGTVYVRYRDADTDQIEEISHRLTSRIIRRRTPQSDPRFYLAAGVAEFAEVLRHSEHARDGNLAAVQSVFEQVSARLPLDTQVRQLVDLVRRAQGLPPAP